MRFTVTWRFDQKQKLANIWLAATDRKAVSTATDQIDKLLSENPESAGADFYGDLMLAVPPIGVVYTVSVDDRLVKVVYVWHNDQMDD